MLKSEGKVSHIPVYPEFITPIPNKFIELSQQLKFDFIKPLQDIISRYK